MDGADKGAARAVLKVSWKFRQDLSIVCRRFVALVSFCFKAASLVGISRALTCFVSSVPVIGPGCLGTPIRLRPLLPARSLSFVVKDSFDIKCRSHGQCGLR